MIELIVGGIIGLLIGEACSDKTITVRHTNKSEGEEFIDSLNEYAKKYEELAKKDIEEFTKDPELFKQRIALQKELYVPYRPQEKKWYERWF